MRVALVQLEIAWEDKAENYRRAERRIQEAVALGAQLIVLPELFCCGFSMNTAMAEPEGGPTELFLRDVAEGLGVHLLAGVPELGAAKAENRALLVRPGQLTLRYTKLHPFSFSEEQQHYQAGTSPVIWELEGLRIAPFICYDLRFPEVFRQVANHVDAFIVIASWPATRRAHWQSLLKARAIENQAWVLGVNRVGEGGGLSYAGDSVIHDPLGEAVASVAMQEALIVADIDPKQAHVWRRTFPALKDRRF
jgi:predicted amidohydrolase